MIIPVALFVFNRPKHTEKTLESLSNNVDADKINLFVFCDTTDDKEKLANVCKVKEIINQEKWKKKFKEVTVIERKENFGLYKNVTTGANYMFNNFESCIFLEDDLQTSRYFYQNMSNALLKYKDDERVWEISGFTPNFKKKDQCKNLFFLYRANSWGWATWKKNWMAVNWNKDPLELNKAIYKNLDKAGNDLKYLVNLYNKGKIDSWATRWCYYAIKNNKYTLYFKNSLVKNIGLDNSGTHSKQGSATNKFIVNINEIELCSDDFENIEYNKKINDSFNKNFNDSIFSKIKWKLNICNWR